LLQSGNKEIARKISSLQNALICNARLSCRRTLLHEGIIGLSAAPGFQTVLRQRQSSEKIRLTTSRQKLENSFQAFFRTATHS